MKPTAPVIMSAWCQEMDIFASYPGAVENNHKPIWQILGRIFGYFQMELGRRQRNMFFLESPERRSSKLSAKLE